MTKARQIKLNILNIVVFTIIGIILFTGSRAIYTIETSVDILKSQLEQHWREQARNTLDDVINQFDNDSTNGLIDLYDNASIGSWTNIHFSGIRNGGPTSDGWVAELASEEFIDDQSEDCSRDEFEINGRFFKDEAIMHVDPELAEKVLNRIRSGEPTKYGENIWWNFDGEPEWIEFKFYPIKRGLGGEPRTIGGIKNESFRRFVFVLGTQSDEIYAPYKSYILRQESIIKYLYILITTSFISSIIFMFVVIFKRH